MADSKRHKKQRPAPTPPTGEGGGLVYVTFGGASDGTGDIQFGPYSAVSIDNQVNRMSLFVIAEEKPPPGDEWSETSTLAVLERSAELGQNPSWALLDGKGKKKKGPTYKFVRMHERQESDDDIVGYEDEDPPTD